MQKEKKHKWGLKGNMYMNTVKTEKNPDIIHFVLFTDNRKFV